MNSGKTKKNQKHKNTTAFKITFDTQALQIQKKVSLRNLCVRCNDVMVWKLQYNKYKKMTEPAKCNICEQRNVLRTYMKACQGCVQSKNICAKCLTPDYEAPAEVKQSVNDIKKQQKQQHHSQIQFMKTLQQRSRRTVRRGLEKHKISWDPKEQYFVDEEGNKMSGLHFRKGFTLSNENSQDIENGEEDLDENEGLDDDQDMFGDDQDLDEEQQQKGNNKTKKGKSQKQVSKNKQSNVGCQKVENKKQKDSDVQGDQVQCGIDDQEQNEQNEQNGQNEEGEQNWEDQQDKDQKSENKSKQKNKQNNKN